MAKLGVSILCLLPVMTLQGLCGYDGSDPGIAEVERNLLPYTMIEGEAPFTLRERMAHYHVPGVSIAVIEHFEIAWVVNYGVIDHEGQKGVTDTTMFAVGSLSKAVTAMSILSLAQDGLVDLFMDVNDQLKSLRLPENEFTRQADVTPLSLMNHSGGVVFSPPFSYSADRFPTVLQLLQGNPPAVSQPVKVDRIPGTTFQYSNAGFSILELLTEDVTGRPFPEIVAERVFVPLEMRHSAFALPLPSPYADSRATGHRHDGNTQYKVQQWVGHVAAGGLWSTATDYARFIVEVQKSLLGKGNRIISTELCDLMLSPQAAEQYGLGVFLSEQGGGEQYFSHIGDAPGFVAGFSSHKTRGCGAVIVTNGQRGINLIREVLRSIGKVYDWPGYLPPLRSTIPIEAEFVNRAVGRYRLGLDGVIRISSENSSLFVELPEEQKFRLFAATVDTFVCKERKGEFVFPCDDDAQINRVTVHLSDEFGRFTEQPRTAIRMAPDERIPFEFLLAGEGEEAFTRYRNLQRQDPTNPEIAESRFNSLGYRLINQGKHSEAVSVFHLNVKLYPESANTYDSLGEAYMLLGEKALAIKSYKRSLELNPDNSNATEKLKELGPVLAH